MVIPEPPPNSKQPQHQQPALLRLPSPVRHRIYRFLGLASWDSTRPYLFDLHGRIAFSEVPLPQSFHGLLLSCRYLYTESSALLYSANRFIIPYSRAGSLGPLRTLRAQAISSLTNLRIVLNQASCHHPDRYNDGPGHCCQEGREEDDFSGAYHCKKYHRLHSPPLLGPVPEGNDGPLAAVQTLVDEWRLVASRLASHLVPGRLELSLVCDIDSEHEQTVDVAKSVVEPLRFLPSLKNCHVRLCKTPDCRLQRVAQEAALGKVGITTPYLDPSPTQQRNLMTLPRELRLRILEYTDLITPGREVTWSREDSDCKYTGLGYGCKWRCPHDARSICHFTRCWYLKKAAWLVGCFCRRRHAAFSTTDTCTCWSPPGPNLFLVCRALYKEAQLVFFSGNRFIVHDFYAAPAYKLPELPLEDDPWGEGPWPSREPYPYERFAASHFLRDVMPTDCIAHLRFLELVFPPYYPPTWPETDHPAMQDWRKTVSWLRDKINGPALTLRLVVAPLSHVVPINYLRVTITVEEGEITHEAYMNLVRPLRQLAEGPNALAKFYASLPYPWEQTEASKIRGRGDNWYWLHKEVRELRERTERLVMGDRYDSLYAVNKEAPEVSLWEDIYYNVY